MFKRFIVALLVLLAIYGAFAWNNMRKRPARIIEPCFDTTGRWYVRAE